METKPEPARASESEEHRSAARLDPNVISDPHVLYQTLVEQLPAIVYLSPPDDPDDVRYVSSQVERVLGFGQEEWLAQRYFWKERLHPDDRDRVLDEDADADAQEDSFVISYRLFHQDGHEVWLRDHGVLVRDPDGTPRFWLGFAFDISQQKQVEDALRDAEDRYRTLVEQIPAVTFTVGVDTDHPPIYISPQIENMLGYSLEEWQAGLEFWFSVVHPDDLPSTLEGVRRTTETGEPFSREFRMIARDGRTVWVQNESQLLRDAQGKPSFWHGVMLDITDRKLAEEALRETELRYRTLVEQIPVVTFIEPHDGNGIPTYISPQIETLLGYSQEEWREHPDIGIRSIHPDDVTAWREALARTDRTGEPYDLEHRMITRDGHTIWVRSTARLVYDEGGRPQFWQGTMLDITEAVLADQRLAESEQRYRSLFDHNPDPVYSFDLDGRLVSANAALSEVTGYSMDEVLGMSFAELVASSDVPEVARHFREAAAGAPQEYECRARRKDGSTVDVHVTNLPIIVGGEIVGVYGVAKDISQRKSLERQLKHMAFHDWLTGLPNRLLFSDRLDQALAALHRRSGSIAVLFVDLDNFKQINDSFGHDVGDEALKAVARLISSCIRSGDTIARMGGDEFTILLLDVEGPESAQDVAERILRLLGRPIVVEGHELTFSASIGVVLSSSPDDDSGMLLRRVDQAMYQAKLSGKAQYQVHEESASER